MTFFLAYTLTFFLAFLHLFSHYIYHKFRNGLLCGIILASVRREKTDPYVWLTGPLKRAVSSEWLWCSTFYLRVLLVQTSCKQKNVNALLRETPISSEPLHVCQIVVKVSLLPRAWSSANKQPATTLAGWTAPSCHWDWLSLSFWIDSWRWRWRDICSYD